MTFFFYMKLKSASFKIKHPNTTQFKDTLTRCLHAEERKDSSEKPGRAENFVCTIKPLQSATYNGLEPELSCSREGYQPLNGMENIGRTLFITKVQVKLGTATGTHTLDLLWV